MGIQGGQSGVGMRKQAIIGQAPKSGRAKNAEARRANEEIERAANLRKKRANAEPKFSSVSECFKFHNRKKY